MQTYIGQHPAWIGEIHLHEDGKLNRPGVDEGRYELHERRRLILRWDRWAPEELVWDERRCLYHDPNKAFSLWPSHSTEAAVSMTRIYIDAVCDLFHWGHVEMFRQARSLAVKPYLIIGLNDAKDIDYKDKPTLSFDERRRVVESCRLVDEVVHGPVPATEAFLKTIKIDLLVHGDDITNENRARWYSDAIEMGIYREVPYTPGISSRDIRRRACQAANQKGYV